MNQGYEPQYPLKCNCDVRVAYQCFPFEELEIRKKSDSKNYPNKPYIYILNDALVTDMKKAKLMKEIKKLEEAGMY